jgi:hypothetical protein
MNRTAWSRLFAGAAVLVPRVHDMAEVGAKRGRTMLRAHLAAGLSRRCTASQCTGAYVRPPASTLATGSSAASSPRP